MGKLLSEVAQMNGSGSALANKIFFFSEKNWWKTLGTQGQFLFPFVSLSCLSLGVHSIAPTSEKNLLVVHDSVGTNFSNSHPGCFGIIFEVA